MCKGLAAIYLQNCNTLTSETFFAFSGLTKLYVEQRQDQNTITDADVAAVATHCPDLASATFQNCCKLTDVSMIALAEGCHDLTKVEYRNCGGGQDGISDVGVIALAQGCRRLKKVRFGVDSVHHAQSERMSITDPSISLLAQCCADLTDVVLQFTMVTNSETFRSTIRPSVSLSVNFPLLAL